jgi:septal ring factor EnvC (AmiA/AmiB activator)
MRRSALNILIVFTLLSTSVLAQKESDKIKAQRRELESIQRDVEAGQRRLDSLQVEERRVQDAIGNYDERISSDRRVIMRLSGELGGLQADIAQGDSLLGEHQILLERQKRRHLGNIRQFYALARQPMRTFSDHPTEELDYYRKVVYLSALAEFEAGMVEGAEVLVDQSSGNLDDMSDRERMITGLKKDRETSFAIGRSQRERQEKSLDQLRRKSMAEADRVIMLREAAAQMRSIIARLEKARERAASRAEVPSGPSAFAALRNQLLSPFRGKVIEAFGGHTDPVTHLKSFSPGITINGNANAGVYCVASGTVAYTGSLRGYGNFVIINHDHQYYSTYAGLGEILVSNGQFIQSRTKVGTSGRDGRVKFELRRGSEPLDPVKWIKIESL